MRFIDVEDATRVARVCFGDDVYVDVVCVGDDLSDVYDVCWFVMVFDQSVCELFFFFDGFRLRERRRDGGEIGVCGFDFVLWGVGFENDLIEWNCFYYVEVFLGFE